MKGTLGWMGLGMLSALAIFAGEAQARSQELLFHAFCEGADKAFDVKVWAPPGGSRRQAPVLSITEYDVDSREILWQNDLPNAQIGMQTYRWGTEIEVTASKTFQTRVGSRTTWVELVFKDYDYHSFEDQFAGGKLEQLDEFERSFQKSFQRGNCELLRY